jgi:outer membrane receptor protein involved in Fe transport
MRACDPSGSPQHCRAALAALLATGLALAFVAPALAAEAKPRAAVTDTIQPVLFLKETLVTGARYPRLYYDSPQALSFVSSQQLRESAPVVLGDVLSTIPGVESNKDSPWEQRPSIRGLTGQRVLVLVDGSPMNSVRGNGPHPSLLDPTQVERIEVVRGPSSVAYGSDALGGVINIITREPRFSGADQVLRGSASLGGSVSGLPARNGSLEFSARARKFSGFFAGGGRKTDDFRNADGTIPHSSFSDWNALANLRYDLTDRLALKGGYQLYRASNVGIPGLDFEFPGASQIFQFKVYDRDYAHLTLEHQYPASSWLASTRINTHWQREHRNFYSDQVMASYMLDAFGIPPRAGAASATTLQDRFLDLNTYGLQVQLTSIKTQYYRFSAGLDGGRDVTGGNNVRYRTYHDATGAQVGAKGLRTSASVPVGRFDNYAGFLQGEFFLAPQWTVDVGGRSTIYRYRTDSTYMQPGSGFRPQSRDDNALSGSLGVVYNPIADLHLTANVANGYREPNAQDLFFSGPGSVGFVIGNPDLKPERSVSYDLGLRWGPRTLAISGNVFYSTFKDLINALPYTPAPPEAQGQKTYRYTNITTATMWGGEAEAEWQFRPQWTVRTAISGTVGDITNRSAILEIYGVSADRVPLELVPPFRGQASLRWNDPDRRFWAEAGTRYSWRTNRLPPVTVGAEQLAEFKKEWIVGDVSAGIRFDTGQRVVVGVRNFTDLRYRQALGSVVEPGATTYVSLCSDF